MIYGNVGGTFRVFETREEYEAWITARREAALARDRKARKLRRWSIAAMVGALLASILYAFVVVGEAAPLQTPKDRPGLQEPEASPQRGVTLAQMREACERRGGHWLEEDGGEQLPNHKVVGCLFAVPKSAR